MADRRRCKMEMWLGKTRVDQWSLELNEERKHPLVTHAVVRINRRECDVKTPSFKFFMPRPCRSDLYVVVDTNNVLDGCHSQASFHGQLGLARFDHVI